MNGHSVGAQVTEASAHKRDRRRQILDAAVEVFSAAGFHKSRVSDIARTADVADGTIYLYFKSKDDILISIFEETMSEMIEGVEAAIAGHDDPFERLRRFADYHMGMVETKPRVAKVLQVELRLSNTFMKEYRPARLQQYMNIIGRLIDDGKTSGRVRQDVNTIIARRAFFGALDEIAMQWMLTPNARYGLRESARQVAELFVRGLCA
jgi:TetR/AcrR family transcriptional regulator, fatty acid metabolism regulator protein